MANNRKSIQEHEMAGTFRKDRHEGKTEKEWTILNQAPEPPAYFDEVAREAWTLITNELIERNDLCTVYLGQLEQYCYSICLAKRATVQLDQTLTTPSKANPAVSPYFRIYSQACKTVMDIGDKFGFNSKARLNLPNNSPESRLGDNPGWSPSDLQKNFDMNDPKQKEAYKKMEDDYYERYPYALFK